MIFAAVPGLGGFVLDAFDEVSGEQRAELVGQLGADDLTCARREAG